MSDVRSLQHESRPHAEHTFRSDNDAIKIKFLRKGWPTDSIQYGPSSQAGPQTLGNTSAWQSQGTGLAQLRWKLTIAMR